MSAFWAAQRDAQFLETSIRNEGRENPFLFEHEESSSDTTTRVRDARPVDTPTRPAETTSLLKKTTSIRTWTTPEKASAFTAATAIAGMTAAGVVAVVERATNKN